MPSRGGLPGIALLVLLTALAATTTAAADERDRADRRLQSALERFVDLRGAPPGAIAVLQRGAERRTFTAGVAETTRDARLRGGKRMRIASTSKAFSGAVALSLVEAGLLRLDDTIGGLLPDLPAEWHPITLEQLLKHTSGLPDFTANPAFGQAVLASPTVGPPPRELLAFAAGTPLNFPPGSDYRYSNSDNVAAGLMIEAATGGRYGRELRRRITEPLGLGRTYLRPALKIPRPIIHGYEPTAGSAPDDVSELFAFGAWAWASGGVVSTSRNLSRFIRAYAGGRLFAGPARAAQYDFRPASRSEPPGPGRNSAGAALFSYRTNCGSVFGHTGSITGYTQLIAAGRNGRRSLTFSVNSQIQAGDPLLQPLRRAQRRAVCAALAG